MWGHFLWCHCCLKVRLCYLNYNNTYSGSVLSIVILINMTIKFRQFKKNHTCLTSCQTTSGVPIGDLIVAFCTHLIIFRKSHERTASNAEQKFLLIQNWAEGFFLPPSAIRGLIVHQHSAQKRLFDSRSPPKSRPNPLFIFTHTFPLLLLNHLLSVC